MLHSRSPSPELQQRREQFLSRWSPESYTYIAHNAPDMPAAMRQWTSACLRNRDMLIPPDILILDQSTWHQDSRDYAGIDIQSMGAYFHAGCKLIVLPQSLATGLEQQHPTAEYVLCHEMGHAALSHSASRRNALKVLMAPAAMGAGALLPSAIFQDNRPHPASTFASITGTGILANLGTRYWALHADGREIRKYELEADQFAIQVLGLPRVLDGIVQCSIDELDHYRAGLNDTDIATHEVAARNEIQAWLPATLHSWFEEHSERIAAMRCSAMEHQSQYNRHSTNIYRNGYYPEPYLRLASATILSALPDKASSRSFIR